MHVGDTLQFWSLDRLKAYERNSRTHSDEQIAKVAASITRFGFTNPILATDDGTIVASHGRLLAARVLGIATVPVIFVTGWTEDEIRAYVIADNQLALEAGWDEEILRLELGDLREKGFDLGLTGFDGDALAALLDMRPDGAVDPDEAPAAPANPTATRGDLWALGRHRLLCGDATSAEDTAMLLNGTKPHLMVTDPPYGVNYDASWRNSAAIQASKTIGHSRAIGKVENDDRADWTDAWKLFTGDVAYVWHGALHGVEVQGNLEVAGFQMRAQIIWAKNNIVISRGHYHFKHEPCWYAVRKGATGHWTGDRKQTSLWEIDKPMKSETGHSTQKPVECMKRPIENNSKPGDSVYEPFSGSGTTIIAAEMTGRTCLALEISPAYVDVAIQRWQTFTGLTATLESTGQTYAAVTEARALVAA
jgi:DNA modification methylase